MIYNTYRGGNIETDHHVILLIAEDVPKHFVFPNFVTPVTGTLRGVLDNETTPRDKIYLNGLGMIKGKSGGASMMLKTGMEVDQYYIVFNYSPPRPQKDLKYQY